MFFKNSKYLEGCILVNGHLFCLSFCLSSGDINVDQRVPLDLARWLVMAHPGSGYGVPKRNCFFPKEKI